MLYAFFAYIIIESWYFLMQCIIYDGTRSRIADRFLFFFSRRTIRIRTENDICFSMVNTVIALSIDPSLVAIICFFQLSAN